ncbi:MAG: hypothetical protein AAFQ67_03000 [Pseudomonadota bacterium]
MRSSAPVIVCGLALAACASTPPPPDRIKPQISLSLLDPAPVLIGSNNPTADLATGCPNDGGVDSTEAESFFARDYGPVAWSETAIDETYFYSTQTPPYRFSLKVTDAGGVERTRIAFSDQTIDADTPNGSIVIAEVAPKRASVSADTSTASEGGVDKFRIVEHVADPEKPQTELETSFTASSLGAGPFVSVSAQDTAGNTDRFFIWLLPRTLCQ